MAMRTAPRLVTQIGLIVALAFFIVARRFLRDPATGQALFPVLMKLVLAIAAVILVAAGPGGQSTKENAAHGTPRRVPPSKNRSATSTGPARPSTT